MQYDYYAFRKEELGNLLNEFEHTRDKNIQKRIAEKLFKVKEQDEQEQIESHLPYLWYEAVDCDLKNLIRDAWQKLNIGKDTKLAKQIQNLKKLQDEFLFIPNVSDIENLQQFSFILRVNFKLKKPYLSKDDRAFHLLDNSLKKDKVFQIPMIASTSWKGSLRAALRQMENGEKNEQIIRLFGNERKEQEHKKLKSGRLYFYPTFFDRTSLEVINPHDRKKGTGKNPIFIESVPVGTIGDFVVVYIPFGSTDKKQIAKDLDLVMEGVKAMLTVYGFGAKTSSGFGIAEQQVIGQIVINCSFSPQISPRPQEPEYPEQLRLFLEQYPNEDFQLSPKEWRKLNKASQPQQEFYREAKNKRSTYKDKLKTYESEFANWKTQANAPPLPQISKNFNTLVEMVSKAKEIVEHLHQSEEINYES